MSKRVCADGLNSGQPSLLSEPTTLTPENLGV
jgi:hypothetical protein